MKKTPCSFSSSYKRDKNILPTQLWGGLKDIDSLETRKLLIEIDEYTDYPWLKPHHYMHSPEGALKMILTGHTLPVCGVCVSPDGKYIASGSGGFFGNDYTIRVWDWEKQEEIQILKGHTQALNSVCFSPDGKIEYSEDNFNYNVSIEKKKGFFSRLFKR